MREPIRVLHVINDLAIAGAQSMLVKLCASDSQGGLSHRVVSLLPKADLAEELRSAGIEVTLLDLTPVELPAQLRRLARIIGGEKPHVVQGWMYHGNLAATAANAIAETPAVVSWNIRHSVYDLRLEKPSTSILIRLGARASTSASAIIYNSHTSRVQHGLLGYEHRYSSVIPNGFDTHRFRPDSDARLSLRRDLGLDEDTELIGLVARFHPMKNHEVFLEAADLLILERPGVHFVLAGDGVMRDNQDLMSLVNGRRSTAATHLLGLRDDVQVITAALDVATSCSAWGEGFPNAIGEALACGIPCVVTDRGDSVLLVGDSGTVVPVGDPAALALAWHRLLTMGEARRERLGSNARSRIVRDYSLPSVVAEYHDLYEQLSSR